MRRRYETGRENRPCQNGEEVGQRVLGGPALARAGEGHVLEGRRPGVAILAPLELWYVDYVIGGH